MLTIFDGLRNITFGTVLLRLLLAFLCGGAIGMERSYKTVPRASAPTCSSASAAPWRP